MLLPTKVKVSMKLPPLLDTRFAQFLQVLPADYHEQAYAFKAFAHPRKIKSPLLVDEFGTRADETLKRLLALLSIFKIRLYGRGFTAYSVMKKPDPEIRLIKGKCNVE